MVAACDGLALIWHWPDSTIYMPSPIASSSNTRDPARHSRRYTYNILGVHVGTHGAGHAGVNVGAHMEMSTHGPRAVSMHVLQWSVG